MTKIRLLLAEDDETDALLLIHQLKKEGFDIDHKQVKTFDDMDEALELFTWDIVISDYAMPGFGGPQALELFKSKNLDIPFILVSGTVGEDIAVNIMKGGANDYLMKTHLNRLGPAVRRELAETALKREKKHVESVLNRTELRFKRLIEDLTEVVWLSSINGEKTYIVNPALEKITGKPISEMSFNPVKWENMIEPEDRPLFRQFILQLGESGMNSCEYRIRRTNGSVGWVFDRRYKVHHHSDEEDMVGGILSDISDKKKAEEDLVHARKMAEESSRLKSALLQNMSHEFRTPMNGILGFSEILAREISDQNWKMMSEFIHTSGKRLMYTLNSIMMFAQFESGIQPILKPVDLSAKIDAICNTLTDQILRKGLSVEIKIEGPLTVCTDSFMMHQILFNLLENAVKFTSTGSITITGVINPSGNAQISIRDTGIGIAPEKQHIIFEEFRQAEEGFNRPFEGSGLGLAIVRKAIESLNGSISLESEPGNGSTFTVTIPAGPCEELSVPTDQPAETKSVVSNGEYNRPSVLIVEDNETNVELLTLFLRKDYIADVARCGEKALELTASKKYDIILMDINLGPGIDGIETIEKIRNHPEYKETPIIAVTGYTFRNEKQYILSKGADHYLEKPFTKQALTGIMDKATGNIHPGQKVHRELTFGD